MTTDKHAKQTHIRPKKTYGMPSTHSTALTFYLAYLVPALLGWGGSSNGVASSSTRDLPLSPLVRYLAAAAVMAYWVGGIWSRIELGYHTPEQCYGGAALGGALAFVWRAVWVQNPAMAGWVQNVMDEVWGLTLGRVGL